MKYRTFILLQTAALLFTLSPLIPPQIAHAADGMSWQFNEGNDPDNKGRMTARLTYGVPETDNVQVTGVCEARSGSGLNTSSLTFAADIGDLKDGEKSDLRFSGGGREHSVSGSVHIPKQEEAIVGVRLDLDNDDPLWEALTEINSLDYLVPGYRASSLELTEGRGNIKKFIEACRSYAEALAPRETASQDNGMSEKEAFDAAKELGTVEAWDAYLSNFPKGFRADLARAYVKKLGGTTPTPPQDKKSETPTPPPPTGEPDISISQTANQASCNGGSSCSYTIVATNLGGKPYSGEIVIANSMAPAGAKLTTSGPAPWYCEEMGGGAVCTNANANLGPGQSVKLSLTFTLPRNAGRTVNSCASISWGGAPTGSSVRDVQQELNEQGFKVGRPDGKAGRKTTRAIRTYQERNGLVPTGEIDLPLLLALFTKNSTGDADPGNDKACADSSVNTAPVQDDYEDDYEEDTRPVARYCSGGRLRKRSGKCVCPADASHWTGRTCIPKRRRNCTGGRYYSKRKKLCLCPRKRPHWYNGRCHARVDDCPGDSVRVGNQCIKENDPGFQVGPGFRKDCTGGRFRNKRGKCRCPRGQKFNGKRCFEFNKQNRPGRNSGCKGGQFRTRNGNCTCPKGSQYIGGTCVNLAPILNQLGIGNKNKNKNKQKFKNKKQFKQQQQPKRNKNQNQNQNQNQQKQLKQLQKQLQNLFKKPKKNKPQPVQNKKPKPVKKKPAAPNAPKAPPPPKPINKPKKCPGNLVPAPGGGCTVGKCGPNQVPTANGCVNIIPSDRRLKKDMTHIATLESGIKLYSFRYLWDETMHVGVMAQDLLADPATRDAVVMTSSGFYAVNYEMLGLRMVTLKAWHEQGQAAMLLQVSAQ